VYFLYLAWRSWKSVSDACRDRVILIPVGVYRRSWVPEFERHRIPLTGSRWDIRWLIGRRSKPTFCVFSVLNVAVMEKCCDACGYGEYYFRSVFSDSEGAGVYEASTTVDRKSMGQTVTDRSSNEADFQCILLYLAWRLWKSVVTLAVKGNTICGRFSLFQRHRLPLTGSRWDIRWLIGRRSKPTFCVFSVLNVAVMEKCCDACGHGEYYFRSGFSTLWGAAV
jgi:predicted nucleic-acid-binding Zn-ribbon protein